jgi:hypothetical protein
MINVHMDKTCCHCEKEHVPCAMFLTEHVGDDQLFVDIPVHICCQCLSDAVSAVVTAQMLLMRKFNERYRNGSNT